MNEPMPTMRSAVSLQPWPALPSARGAELAAMLYQFSMSERLAPDALLSAQFTQLSTLLRHARDTVPYYRELLADRAWASAFTGSLESKLAQWRTLPLLPRRAVQTSAERLHSASVPAVCEPVYFSETSGSTGEPVRVKRTALDNLMWEVHSVREHQWHAIDPTARLAAIRVLGDDHDAGTRTHEATSWGGAIGELYNTGPLALLALDTDIREQARWLSAYRPQYLVTYPTNLDALLDLSVASGWTLPELKFIRTVGETVSAALRDRCRALWNVDLIDVYSSREIGYLALECPDSGLYHVTAESVFLEVLLPDGQPAGVGETGRVVVTPLHNYAMPLLRYELNDYAEVGPACPCGRGLPTLTRILGRSRNMVRRPDGERYWPVVGFGQFRDIAPIRQYQLVQETTAGIEIRLVADRALTQPEEAAVAAVVRRALGYPFDLRFKYFDEDIPRGSGGKYEEFICLVDNQSEFPG